MALNVVRKMLVVSLRFSVSKLYITQICQILINCFVTNICKIVTQVVISGGC